MKNFSECLHGSWQVFAILYRLILKNLSVSDLFIYITIYIYIYIYVHVLTFRQFVKIF